MKFFQKQTQNSTLYLPFFHIGKYIFLNVGKNPFMFSGYPSFTLTHGTHGTHGNYGTHGTYGTHETHGTHRIHGTHRTHETHGTCGTHGIEL